MDKPRMEAPSQAAKEGDTVEDLQEQVAVPRQSYNTGHGDFCFGRLLDKQKYDRDRQLGPGLRENNVLFIEKDGFQRAGPFPFSKLPIEIRYRTFGLLCGPCYGSEDGLIEIILTPYPTVDATKPGWWNQTFDQYQARTDNIFRGYTREREDDELKFAKRQREFITEGTPHPYRARFYGMSIRPVMAADFHKFGDAKDWSIIELIRNVSNVSTHFRKDFGDVFWERTKITFDEMYFDPENNIHSWFFEDRPSICSGVRSLDIDVQFDWFNIDSDLERQQFLQFTQTISRLPHLENLRLLLCMPDTELCKLKAGIPMRTCLETFRKLPAIKKFNLWVYIHVSYFSKSVESEKVESEKVESEKQLEEKWTPITREIMLPNTLQAAKTMSETERYLRSREVDETNLKKSEEEIEMEEADESEKESEQSEEESEESEEESEESEEGSQEGEYESEVVDLEG
ncbi:hypothetical protein N431DRAFT_458428 [Stipitochalara longipes BDJ]|nr:hypothetical protein N431DRAFT_458428 [Stipitochalara longipes BDJ]